MFAELPSARFVIRHNVADRFRSRTTIGEDYPLSVPERLKDGALVNSDRCVYEALDSLIRQPLDVFDRLKLAIVGVTDHERIVTLAALTFDSLRESRVERIGDVANK